MDDSSIPLVISWVSGGHYITRLFKQLGIMWKFSYLLGKHADFGWLWGHEKTVASCDKRPIDVCSVRSERASEWASRRVSNPILIKYAQAEIAHWTKGQRKRNDTLSLSGWYCWEREETIHTRRPHWKQWGGVSHNLHWQYLYHLQVDQNKNHKLCYAEADVSCERHPKWNERESCV